MKKKMVALFMAVTMVCSLTACKGEEVAKETSEKKETTSVGETQEVKKSDTLDWLNVGELPIVEEGTKKTLTMAICMNEVSGNPEDMWAYKFIENAMNIDIEVTKFTSQNKSEFLSLLFADDELPDIIIGGAFSGTELVEYGALEGQIIDLAPYITEENMPNLYSIYEEHPEYKKAISDQQGRIWSLGTIKDPYDKGEVSRAFLNYDWLEEAALEVPTTLEDFINVMRTFKERGDDVVPMGGCYAADDPTLIVLNAYGYLTRDAKALSICTRDGKVVWPASDREVFGEYLKTMNLLYSEGLIVSDFYTMDSTTSKAMISEGNVGFVAQAPFVYNPETVSSWWGALPLTSEYNSEQMWPASTSAIGSGNFVVTSACEDVELAMAFVDFTYQPDSKGYSMFGSGPASTQTDYLYDGIRGYLYELDENGRSSSVTYPDFVENPNLYSNLNDYRYKNIMLWQYNTIGYNGPTDCPMQEMYGLKPDQYTVSYSYDEALLKEIDEKSDLRKHLTGETHFRNALKETVVPYAKLGLSTAFLDENASSEASKLEVILKEYASQEIAKFVTGARSLDELDAYFDELERLGSEEYVNIYKEYYENAQ